MATPFRIAIVRDDERIALLIPGSTGERDLIASITDAAVKRGVGLFRTEAQVRRAIADGCHDVLLALKREVMPL